MAYTFSARELREFRAKHPEKAKHSFMVALKGNRHNPFGIWFENPEPFLRKNTFNYVTEEDFDWDKISQATVIINSPVIRKLTDYAMHRMQFANFPPDMELTLRENTEGQSIREMADHIFGNLIDQYTLPPMAQIYQDPRLDRYVATWFVLEINNDDAEDLVDFGYIIPVARDTEVSHEERQANRMKLTDLMVIDDVNWPSPEPTRPVLGVSPLKERMEQARGKMMDAFLTKTPVRFTWDNFDVEKS